MKVEKTRKLYKKRKHNKEIKRSRQPWNKDDSTSDMNSQESNDEEVNEVKEITTTQQPQSIKVSDVPEEVIQFFNNPQTLLEFKQFQEYLKIKDTIRTRSNSETKDIPSLATTASKNTSDKMPLTPPTTPTITKSKPLPAEIDLLTSIDEEEDLSDSMDEIVETKTISQRNNASF